MTDHATPNLPSRSFSATQQFYAALGFTTTWQDEHWMIMVSGSVVLEFFPHPELDPYGSWFSCCLRLDDVEAFYRLLQAAGIPEKCTDFPRIHPPKMQPWGLKMGALVDPDGTLIRLIENEKKADQQA
ncbi:bleomycin resistance protein [Erwinia sp. S38]|uniref:bleomycin resistance protein n=1 Tax=Erwinia sp. S38 TaxID=2769338 RepID=UPI001909FA72|nr:bleomycin resistance protein [Erwinia sp. S38]MBK0000196.1 bleomycin resistance protein [Erwinia sp. S38]